MSLSPTHMTNTGGSRGIRSSVNYSSPLSRFPADSSRRSFTHSSRSISEH
jgi:hypothetical protein